MGYRAAIGEMEMAMTDLDYAHTSTMLYGLVLLIVYLLPAINAYSKKHRSRALIMAINVLLGWTLIGWVWALAWSAGNVKDAPAEPSPETHVKCPDCAELVLRQAKVCKHCRCRLVPQ
jgi:hypothetical protein